MKLSLRSLRRVGAVLVALAALAGIATPLLALNITPVIVDLSSTGRRTSAVISLQNTFAEAVPVEVSAHPVRVVNGELVESEEEEAKDLLVFPAQATVEGGQTQAFRVQWVGEPAPKASEHFYVTVSQLPVTLPGNQNAIQVLHRFKVLVSVGAPDAKAELRIDKADIQPDENGKPRPVITVSNGGNTYGYLGQRELTIVQRAPDGREVFRRSFSPDLIQRQMGLGLVPSGQTRVLPVNLPLPQADGTLSVELGAATSS
ncbi:fimbria/pilus periplasmic chaperone [Sphingomonas cannabina]|uniref:fimbria/pilus periplasmic chaperone n=1 Tax=Sphingomonas cannabina TaxID=2899123 RepID=UPI001F188C7F|nr:fimbria/pilus periplasmic chaperone [Sphingomonas cannabina]UIJ46637.1 fimbria/pilus periplasmic chaperone [Sphingomonas cannabina]